MTYPTTVDERSDGLREMFGVLAAGRTRLAGSCRAVAWAAAADRPIAARAVVPVWRRPWIVLGSDTFAGDVLRRLGVTHLYADADERYPRPPIDEIYARDRI